MLLTAPSFFFFLFVLCTFTSASPTHQLTSNVSTLLQQLNSSDLASHASLSALNEIILLLKRAQKHDIFAALDPSSSTSSTSKPLPINHNPNDQRCAQGRLVVGVQEMESGLKRRKPTALTLSDARCQHSLAEMLQLLKDQNQSELKLMTDWMQCPAKVQDDALRAFLSAAPVESVLVFFEFVENGADLVRMLISRLEFTLEVLLERTDGRGLGRLLLFLEERGLFARLNDPVKAETCSRLLLKAIECDAHIGMTSGKAPQDAVLLGIVERVWGNRAELLPSVLLEGGLVHPIHLVAGWWPFLNAKYFDFIAPRTDFSQKFLTQVPADAYPAHRFPSRWHKHEAHTIAQLSHADTKLIERCEDYFFDQSPRMKPYKEQHMKLRQMFNEVEAKLAAEAKVKREAEREAAGKTKRKINI